MKERRGGGGERSERGREKWVGVRGPSETERERERTG